MTRARTLEEHRGQVLPRAFEPSSTSPVHSPN